MNFLPKFAGMEQLIELFEAFSGRKPSSIDAIPPTGSNRRYFRIYDSERSYIGVVGTCASENRCFAAMSAHFHSKGIKVPCVLAMSGDGNCYIQEDLGRYTLFEAVASGRNSGNYSDGEKALLKKTIMQLPKIQFEGGRDFDYSNCFQENKLSRRQVIFDLNYFKYCFLKAVKNDFHEASLQDDFEQLADDILASDNSINPFKEGPTFLYRDFQARNVMLRDGEPYFIDFQGGMQGPVYYDLAAFVYQAKAAYPEDFREELIAAYLQSLGQYADFDETSFRRRLSLFVLFRTIQVLGCYGFRGYFEGKVYFVESVPYALANLRNLIGEAPSVLDRDYPYLVPLLREIAYRKDYLPLEDDDKRLVVKVSSFSFRKGIPEDRSGNGGGYVFDCRGMHNPGRYPEYKDMSGLDEPVIRFLEEHGQVQEFVAGAMAMVAPHVECFVRRGFSSLCVNFGCTGGHHRSVYSAEHFAMALKEKFGESIRVHLVHREHGIDRWI